VLVVIVISFLKEEVDRSPFNTNAISASFIMRFKCCEDVGATKSVSG
jgi:hypothetical protein